MAVTDWEYHAECAPEAMAELFHRHADPEEKSLSFHSMPGFQMVWIEEGGGVYNVMGRAYPFRQGDLFLFAERETHYVQQVISSPALRMKSLTFNRRFLSLETDVGMYSEYLRVFTDRSLNYTNCLSGDDPRTERYFEALRGFYEDIGLPGETAACRVRARLLLLLTQIALDHPELLARHPAHAGGDQRIRAAVRYLDEHFREEVTLDELAAQAGLARNYFSAAFRRAQGMLPWEYLTAKRVDCAIRLLSDEGMSVTRAAIESGFNNTANFNRAFRKYTGKTPTEYLRSLKERG